MHNRSAIFVIYLILSFGSRATATSIIIYRTPKFAVIAADSKVSTEQGRYVGTVCKIHIANDIVWVEAGFMQDARGNLNIWNVVRDTLDPKDSFDNIVSNVENKITQSLGDFFGREIIEDPVRYYRMVNVDEFVPLQIAILRGTAESRMFFVVPNRNNPTNISVMRWNCPGSDCIEGSSVIRLGYVDAIDKEWRAKPDIIPEEGIVPALNDLIGAQVKATPDIVGTPIAILGIEFRWPHSLVAARRL